MSTPAPTPRRRPAGDDTLMVRYRDDGDDAAFDELVRRNGAVVLRFLEQRTRDRGLAEDAMAETFMRVIRRRESFERRPRGGFRSWLMTIARRVSIDVARARTREAGFLDRLGADPSVSRLPPPPDPETELLSDQRAAWLDAAVRRLPREHRAALVLYYRYDLDTDEIADTLGLTAQQVRDRIAYGRTILRRVLRRSADAL